MKERVVDAEYDPLVWGAGGRENGQFLNGSP